MDNLEELETTAQEVLGKLKSRNPFQSHWDTAAFIIFLVFLGELVSASGLSASCARSQAEGQV